MTVDTIERDGTRREDAAAQHDEANFFVFRTPLLPFCELVALGDGLRAHALEGTEFAEALRQDHLVVREKLRAAYSRPELREALVIASPSLAESFSQWETEKAAKEEASRSVEQSLIRYFSRMTSRCTPFGLFAGISVGAIDQSGESTRLVVSERASYRKHARLDMYYLAALAQALGNDNALRKHLTYRVNSGLYRAANRLRYPKSRSVNAVRSYQLVGVEPSDYLERVLERARTGVRLGEIIELLLEDPEVTREEAEEFVDELVREQVLVAEIEPGVTGNGPLAELIDSVNAYEEGKRFGSVLSDVATKISAINTEGVGIPTARYHEIGATLAALPVKVEPSKLIQVDMLKPAPHARLSASLLADVRAGVELLRRLDRSEWTDPLKKFKEDFLKRYEEREVPLVEALDEEMGIGFGGSSEAAPLLDGIGFGVVGGADEGGMKWSARDAFLQEKLEALPRDRVSPLVLDAKDVDRISRRTPPPLSYAYTVTLAIDALSLEALEAGDYRIHLKGASGPTGVTMLGRFCHLDRELEHRVREHLRTEEAHFPDAIAAEIVHLPEGRVGNILHRPVLRDHEILFLGRGGGQPDRQIPITDLHVSVRGGQVIVRSAKLNRVVVPRLASAHNFSHGLGIYKFLCTLQYQAGRPAAFSWGPLESRRYLPRLVHGRFVLALARWRLESSELKQLDRKTEAERFAALRQLAAEICLPRFFGVADGDNVLLVDRHNPVSVESFVELVRRRSQANVQEFFPGPEGLCAAGPEGRFTHEIQISFCQRPAKSPTEPTMKPVVSPPNTAVGRSLQPGSECLYLKIYTGTSTADQLLREWVAPMISELCRERIVSRWFYIRYGDPDWHLRLRLFGRADRLWGEVGKRLASSTPPLFADGRVWKLQADTYEREVERYGGSVGIELSEQLFHIDSEACLALVEETPGDDGQNARWRFALVGMDLLLTDLGMSLETKREVLAKARERFGREFGIRGAIEHELGLRYRRERKTFEELFGGKMATESPLRPGIEILRRRSAQLENVAAQLRELERSGELSVPLNDLALSYLHMHANRLLRASARQQELLLYDMLLRQYESQLARARKRPKPNGPSAGDVRAHGADSSST